MRRKKKNPILVVQAVARRRIAAKRFKKDRERAVVLKRRQRERDLALARSRRYNFRRLTHWNIHMLTEEQKEAGRILTRGARQVLTRRRLRQRKAAVLERALQAETKKRQARHREDQIRSVKIMAFRKRRAFKVLETSLSVFVARKRQLRDVAAVTISKSVRGFQTRRLVKRRRTERCEAATRIYSAWRLSRGRASARKFRRSIRALRSLVRHDVERRRCMKRRYLRAATVLERHVRGLAERRRYKKTLIEMVLIKKQHNGATILASLVRRRQSQKRRATLASERRTSFVASMVLTIVYQEALTRRRDRRLLERGAAKVLVAFARRGLARRRRQLRDHRRKVLALALVVERLARGHLGRKRFNVIKAASYRCRHCGGLEFGGVYCKRCGFSRYVGQRPVVHLVDVDQSPYSATFRPGLVKKLRNATASSRQMKLLSRVDDDDKTDASSIVRHPLNKAIPRSLVPKALRRYRPGGTKKSRVSVVNEEPQTSPTTTTMDDAAIANQTAHLLEQARELAAALARPLDREAGGGKETPGLPCPL